MQSAEDFRCDDLPVGDSRREHCRIAQRATIATVEGNMCGACVYRKLRFESIGGAIRQGTDAI